MDSGLRIGAICYVINFLSSIDSCIEGRVSYELTFMITL